MSAAGSVVAALRRRHARLWQIIGATVKGTWADGFVHAGNLAYLSLLTLFPFFIVVAIVAGAIGRTEDGVRAVHAFLRTAPPDVGQLIARPIESVIAVRATSGLLTFGLLVTLWSVSGFIETIRDILRRAYQAKSTLPVWRYRALSVLIVIGAVLLMVFAFAVQVLLTGTMQLIDTMLPFSKELIRWLGIGRIAPPLALFGALWMVFYALTPQRYRQGRFVVWPGPLVTVAVWSGATILLPRVLRLFGGYSLTYGSLAGVIVALLFFWIVGLGLVVGAHLNAALAQARETALKAADEAAERAANG